MLVNATEAAGGPAGIGDLAYAETVQILAVRAMRRLPHFPPPGMSLREARIRLARSAAARVTSDFVEIRNLVLGSGDKEQSSMQLLLNGLAAR